MLRNAKELERYELGARDGSIGQVTDFFFDDAQWTVRYLIVDTGTWLNRREVLISPVAVGRVEWDRRLVHVDLSREQVRNSPGIDPRGPVSRAHELALSRYYAWPAYWGVAGLPEAAFPLPVIPARVPEAASAARETEARHSTLADEHRLHRIGAVRGHAIAALDGEIGHVEDFLIDDRSWDVRYLVIDTRNWWPGKKVIVAPQWIRAVGWEQGSVDVALTRDAIKSSPAYDPGQPVTPDYAGRLAGHYDRSR